MPPLAGFSDNSLSSREDVSTAALALLCSLQTYQSQGGARIRIPVSTGTHFDETAAQLEGFARPLWAVAALVEGSSGNDARLDALAAPFVQGLAHGTDPVHTEYWGAVTGTDQRMVEMEIVSFALLAAPRTFYEGQQPGTKANIIKWLRAINDHPLPITNWLWFRVMTNLALIRCCGLPSQELWPFIEQDLKTLDSFYLHDGWSSDGMWNDQGKQADYYSGSFAIQFSQLLYVKFASDIDPERCSQFRQRAWTFAKDFALYFDKNGAAIPFGRSLTYRFAFAGFWSAAAYADVALPGPLDQPGVVKGLLLRHLRWWASKNDIFNIDGTLNIGFTYPNMYMCEDYNSPQSVYWCMKSFVALGLSASHPFWQAQEQDVPQNHIPLAQAVLAPRHIVCNSSSHHFLLSSGQFCPWPLKATEAKYGKFAYSSQFGFSVPTGALIQQIAPDSAIALSIDNGDSWKTRWIPLEPKWGKALFRDPARHFTEHMPVLLSSWKPWSMFDITVSTALIPPCSRWPEWHVRLHRVTWPTTLLPSISSILATEGGFAIDGRKRADGQPVPTYSQSTVPPDLVSATRDGSLEAVLVDAEGCCVFSRAGGSGIRRLEVIRDATGSTSKGFLLKPDANTNLICQRTVIPTIQSEISLNQGTGHQLEQILAIAVFATASTSAHASAAWADPPVFHISDRESPAAQADAYIEIEDWY